MKRNLSLSLGVCALLSEVSMAEKEGIQYHPVLSWTAPVEEQDFSNFTFMQSSIALQNKLVLIPNGRENYGLIQSRWVSSAIIFGVSAI